MPDLQDWHIRAGFEPTAVKRLLDRARETVEASSADGTPNNAEDSVLPRSMAVASVISEDLSADQERGAQGTDSRVIVLSAGKKSAPQAAGAAKRGRGARRTETREELLNRLLDPVLTLEETARMLEVCPTTVRRYTNRGILPHERSKGNQRRFRLSSVLAFMESQSRVGPLGEEG